MNKKLSIMFAAALAAIIIIAAIGGQAYAANQLQNEAEKAENMIKMAEASCTRVGLLINITYANATANATLKGAGLWDAFQGNVSLYNNGKDFLAKAKICFNDGNFTGAIINATQAMECFREAFKGINRILCLAGIEKGELIQARGLLVAVNRALERIKIIENVRELPDGANQFLNIARPLLNVTEIMELLQEGNVSEVAHRLAEANRLINEAFNALKTQAEENLARRMERFTERLQERLRHMEEKYGANVTELLENIQSFKDNLTLPGPKNWKGLMNQLKAFSKKFKAFSVAVPPKSEEGVPALEVSVEKRVQGKNIVLTVDVKNAGNATLQFPNSVYGITIEKKEDGNWKLAYTPISAQVIVELKPEQTGRANIMLKQPQPGDYRIVVHGWTEITKQPVEAYAEFHLP
ncbi:MAG: hypothetical protein QW222_01480 [Candidatus Bathyarchaeia archaeon]